MKCEQVKELIPDFLVGDLEEDEMEKVRLHLAECEICRTEIEDLSAVWTKLGVLPEQLPGGGLRSRFYSMLEKEKRDLNQREEERSFRIRVQNIFADLWPKQPVLQAAVSFLFLAAGLTIGLLLRSGIAPSSEIAQLRQEMQVMRQAWVVSLLEQESPSERLRGVSISSRMEEPDEQMLDALFKTLNNDPNINVRLSAVDALYFFHDNPKVKTGLIDSLSRQDSSLVQMELIDLMVSLRERRAADALKILILDEKINPAVKDRAEQGIQQLSF